MGKWEGHVDRLDLIGFILQKIMDYNIMFILFMDIELGQPFSNIIEVSIDKDEIRKIIF